ncbi:MAG: hypothetical protein IRY97_01790 [Thermomicrobiaceae bacterium]|nr:hypothetical protein [Thermomicrobiaceae bacterium]
MEQDQARIRRLVLSILEDCSQCGQPHSLDDFRVVGRNGNLWVLTIRCSACDAQAFVAAVIGDQDSDAIQMASVEGWAEDAEANDPVTVDDVLDMHEFLETFDGDFRTLFSRRR